MPIYDFNGTTSVDLGKLYDSDGTADRQIGAAYDNDGVTASLIYKAEQVYTTQLNAGGGYPWTNQSASGISSESINAAGFNTLTGYCYCQGGMSQGGYAYGLTGTATLYLQFADGARLQIASGSATLYSNGSTKTVVSTNFSANIAGYTDAQKSNIKLFANYYCHNTGENKRFDFGPTYARSLVAT